MIHNMFNKDLLTRCNKPQFKEQHVELAPPPTIINMKLKKYGSIGNEAEEHNTWCIGKVMGTNMINGSWNQSCLIQKR